MEKILTAILSNIYVSAFLALCTIIGIPLTLLISHRDKKKKILSISVRTIELVKINTIKNLKTIYKDKEINNLFKTEFIFWNNGNTCLRKEDMAEPIHIEFDDESSILSTNIVSFIDKTNKISIKKTKENKCNLGFEYLKKNQGGKIEIYHTGKDSSIKTKIIMKEGSSVVERSEFNADIKTKKGTNLEPVFGLIFILIFSFIPIMMIVQLIDNYLKNIPTEKFTLCIIAITMMFFGIIVLLFNTIPTIKNEFKIGIPKELK